MFLLPVQRFACTRGPRVSPAGPVPDVLCAAGGQTVKELPQPQPPDALGFLNVNPEPIMVVT